MTGRGESVVRHGGRRAKASPTAIVLMFLLAALILLSLAAFSGAAAAPSYDKYTGFSDKPAAGANTAQAGAPDTGDLIARPGSSAAPTDTNSAANVTGTISGRVTNASGTGLANVEVDVYNEDWDILGYDITDASGNYSIADLPNVLVIPLTYNNQNYVDEWYDNVPYLGNWDGEGADWLDLGATPTQTGINFALATGRSISGRVSTSASVAIADAWVTVYKLDGTGMGATTTESDGTYVLRGLPAGQYILSAENTQGYIDEWYNNVVMATHPDAAGATPVNVTSASATNINFSLALGKTISGTIHNATITAAVVEESVWVTAYDLDGNYIATCVDQEDGAAYLINGLPAGEYLIATSNDLGLVDEWYEDDPFLLDPDGSEAKSVDVRVTNATGKDFTLEMGRTIGGVVTGTGVVPAALSSPTAPLENVEVRIQASTGGLTLGVLTDVDGAYELSGLPAISYVLYTANDQGYVDEWYDNVAVPLDLYGLGAKTVSLASSDELAINFLLDPGTVIGGSVIDSQTDQALDEPGMDVEILNGAGDICAYTTVGGENGKYYATWALPDGTYFAKVTDYWGSDYATEWYDDLKCAEYDLASATPITIPAQPAIASIDTVQVDFELDKMNKYDQTDAHITYVGSYTTYASAPSYGASYARLTATGASATIWFNGTRLDWITMVGTTTGPAKVYVDADPAFEAVDLTATSASYQVKVWSTGELPRGLHKVRIEWNAGTGKYTTLDAVMIDGTIASAPPVVSGISPASGSIDGGTSATISGTGLLGATAVTFDGTPATAISVNPAGTQLTCTTPAHALGAVTVEVTTPSGSDTTTYTYAATPAVNRYDQTNTNIVRTGTWTNYTSAASHLGSYGRSSTAGASATIWFTGTQLDWIAMEGSTTGKADIYVDGVKVTGSTPINLYSSPAAYQQNVWTTGPLLPGLHSVKIVRSTASAAGKYLTLDAVDIYGTIEAPPTRYQQTDSHIVKTGVWSTFSSASASNSSYMRTNTADATATITFTGTRLDWIGMKGTTAGTAEVYVDGALVPTATIVMNASSAVYQQVLFSTGTLLNEEHTVLIKRIGTGSLYLNIDALDIWGAIQ